MRQSFRSVVLETKRRAHEVQTPEIATLPLLLPLEIEREIALLLLGGEISCELIRWRLNKLAKYSTSQIIQITTKKYFFG